MTSEEKKRVWDTLDVLKAGQTRILGLLESDDKTNTKGLVEQVHDSKKKIHEILTRERVLKGKVAQWTIMISAAFTIIVFIVKEILNR